MTDRLRARDLGIAPGPYPPGSHNAITDVPGVRIGQVTLDNGADLHTGVTAIVPDALFARKALPAGLFVGNGYGKLIGATQLAELGEIETPILLTGTLSAFRVADALVTYMISLPGNERVRSINPVVGETNDGELSDIRARPVTEAHVLDAIGSAASGPVAEGCVGAGTGTTALGFKAGIGTSSRMVSLPGSDAPVTLGAIVQANFGGTLTVQGIPIPAATIDDPPADPHEPGNSCVIVVATDAAMDSRQLTRLATRAVFAMARVGASYSHGSGDYGIAFSVSEGQPLRGRDLDPLFAAVQDAVEEALLNSLFMATTTTGLDGRLAEAVSLEDIRLRLARADR